MHPAFSVIFFTTASGAGYGLLALLGVLAPAGRIPDDPWFGATSIACALVLISVGLLASMAHLGHPERAWRAVTQWRTSWLSREGVASLLTYIPAVAFGGLWAVEGQIEPHLGWLTALMCAITVACTAMIYASLKPIRQWSNGWVLPGYLLLALTSGAVWLNALLHLWGREADLFTAVTLVAAFGLKRGYWRFFNVAAEVPTVASATGLKGKVRFLESPHTEDNYLLKEMGYRLARKHAGKLRQIAVLLAFAIPFLLTVLALVGGTTATVVTVLAVPSTMAGLLVERWLFFAEAKHTVTLYYGAETV